MQRVVPLVVALLVVPAAAASTSTNPPGLTGAQLNCKAQGLTIGTVAYTQCVQQQLGASSAKTPASGGSTASGTTVHRAQQICAARGLVPGSTRFMKCLHTAVTAVETAAARKTCTGTGLTRGSAAFARCVKQHLQAGTR
jgi:hypothetical protein